MYHKFAFVQIEIRSALAWQQGAGEFGPNPFDASSSKSGVEQILATPWCFPTPVYLSRASLQYFTRMTGQSCVNKVGAFFPIKTTIAVEIFVRGKLMTFREFLVYFQFRLVLSFHHVFFICRVAALRDSQQQALKSNLMREKGKLQW